MKHLLLFTCSVLLSLSCSKSIKRNSAIKITDGKKIVAYVTNMEGDWGSGFDKAKQITHINFAFANIENGRVVEGSDTDIETLRKINALKQVNSSLKVLVSVGGWTWSKNFSDAVLTEEAREKFADSAIEFMRRHKIDGIDLDWKYPGLPGDGNVHRPEDKENFTAILKLLREKLDKISTGQTGYLLTIASGASQDYLDHTNMREAQKYLDYINIMTYDFHAADGGTGHNAGLATSDYDNSSQPKNTRTAVHQHIKAGIPASKIVLGVPFYGRWKKGVNPENNGLYQIASGASGSYKYHEIVDSLKADKGLTTYWDESAKVPYVWRLKDSLFISYDDERSIKYKVDYAKDNKLGGVMFWQFDGDSNGKLLKTIYEGFSVR